MSVSTESRRLQAGSLARASEDASDPVAPAILVSEEWSGGWPPRTGAPHSGSTISGCMYWSCFYEIENGTCLLRERIVFSMRRVCIPLLFLIVSYSLLFLCSFTFHVVWSSSFGCCFLSFLPNVFKMYPAAREGRKNKLKLQPWAS